MKRLYKIFLVEDEIVTRESIRDRVDWLAAGFEFSGEAPDGEIALPLIQAIQPDVLITDIKMPFMNGLDLCKIVREMMPEVKTVVLSGHDEFNFAQEAIKLGVTEYLLKPTSPQELVAVLQKIALQIDKETEGREQFQNLQIQIADNLHLLHEKFLRMLVFGRISAMEAIKESMQIKLNLIARAYLVVFIKIEFLNEEPSCLNEGYQTSEQIITEVANRSADVLVFAMGLGETVLIFKGDSFDHLRQDSDLLAEAIKEEILTQTNGHLLVGISDPCEHIGDISQAFFDAFSIVRAIPGQIIDHPPVQPARPIELTRLAPTATEAFLKYEALADFDNYFNAYIQPIPAEIQSTRMFLEYIFLSILLTAANFVNELGGDAGKIIPELVETDSLQIGSSSLNQTRQRAQKVIGRALEFRDALTGTQYGALIARAQDFINTHFEDPELSLKMVADRVNLSPSHFSVVFSRETGGTFIEYLTQKRIEKAMTLLITTRTRSSEISERVGYDNPHYFSTVFKKITGSTPIEYRLKLQKGLSSKAQPEG